MTKTFAGTQDANGTECIVETFANFIIFMGMMNELAVTDKTHRSDEPNLPERRDHRDYAGHFWPGHWVFVGPDHIFDTYATEGNWDRRALQTLEACSGLGHPVTQVTTIFEQGCIEAKEDRCYIHLNA